MAKKNGGGVETLDRKKAGKREIRIDALKHKDAKRRNIPTAEFEAVMREEDKSLIRIAYERRNRDLDPQLVWRGKDAQDWSDLVVHAPVLYVQEKVHAKALVDDLIRQTKARQKEEAPPAPDLFAGAGVDLTLAHLKDMRPSTILFHLAKHLLYQKFRDPGEEPKLHLFGQLKRITREWMEDGYLRCTGGTYPAQLVYAEIADMACNRIKAAITEAYLDEKPVKAILDAYNHKGSTKFVNFTTSKEARWQTDPRKCHVNWVVCDSDWEAEFCRVVESHPRVKAYVKNQNLGLEVPYLMDSETRKYLPDFIVQIDDGQGESLNLIVEIKGYRGEDAKEKAATMHAYWVPGVNNLGKFGRWRFAEFTAVYKIQVQFNALIESLLAREPA